MKNTKKLLLGALAMLSLTLGTAACGTGNFPASSNSTGSTGSTSTASSSKESSFSESNSSLLDEENSSFEESSRAEESSDVESSVVEESSDVESSDVESSDVESSDEIGIYGLKYRLDYDNTYIVTGIGSCEEYDIVIPEKYNGLPVTGIGAYAFANQDILSVTIPDTVTYIGYQAFGNCPYLEKVTLGKGVSSVGWCVFGGCNQLKSVYYQGTMSEWCKITFNYSSNSLCNGVKLYINGTLLTDLVIPDDVTSIGNYAFRGCSSLKSIEIPDSVTSIGEYAFDGCSSLTSVTIGNGVTSIGFHAFYDCDSLTNVTIGNGVTSIGEYAFCGCDSLTDVYYQGTLSKWCKITFNEYSSNPLNKGAKLYLEGTLLTELTIPENIVILKNYAFYGCSSLTSVTIPGTVRVIGEQVFTESSLTSIGSSAFYGCDSLTSIVLPDCVTSIGNYAFA